MTETQLAAVAAAVLAIQGTQPPKFQSSVDVTPIDVSVVDDRGRPISDLSPADFTVRIDGNTRRVVSAEWVPLVSDQKAAAAPAAPLPAGYSSNENAAVGRLIMIVVDEPNIRFGGALGLLKAAGAFIDHLSPSDRVAAVGLGLGSPVTPFLADRARVKQAISRMTGQKSTSRSLRQYNIAMTEALSIANGDRLTNDIVVSRECASERTAEARQTCAQMVQFEALEMAQTVKYGADQTIRGLRDVLSSLKAIDGSKTLVLMSEGFVVDATTAEIIEIGALAAAARTSLYALQLDNQLFDITDARMPMTSGADRQARSEGLETLAGASRGTIFRVTGSESAVFDRIEAELAGYYLLGVESDPRDRDGRPHPVRVDVPRRGALVRARRQILTVAAEPRPPSPRAAVARGLSAPLLLSALPLRVATFTLQGPERSKLQLLIHADIGADYATPKRMSLGYVITDAQGRMVDSQAADVRLTPAMTGVPSSLEYVAGASVAPGDYTLRLAVADGDKVGSIEHPIHAALQDAGPVQTSELMVGGPIEAGQPLRPTIGYTVAYGIVHGYLEAYGADAASMRVKYEIATDERSPAIMTDDVAGRPAGEGRVLFTHVTIVRALPPGKYVLRAVMTKDDRPVKTMARAFEVAAPPVLMTSASGLGSNSPSTDGELFLPVEDTVFATPFKPGDALKPATLEPFRARLAPAPGAAAVPAVNAAFEKGLEFLAAKDYVRAEASFKSAIQPDVDSTPGMTYLAVCFAASGHDVEATSAFQTALVDGSDIPQIYLWLSDALLRSHELAAARSVLEEASGRWPSDARFTRPLAMLFATFGKGREAVRTLERYLASGTDARADSEALAVGVEWIYQVHAAGAVVHSRTEDLKLAHGYADRYAKATGPKQELLKQWLDFLDHQK
jgi:VWFA-related protein